MNRRFSAPAGCSPPERESSSWWIVGTAEYQVTLLSRTVRQKESGLNLPGTTMVPPERSVEIVEATRPCTWKSGIAHRETSFCERA